MALRDLPDPIQPLDVAVVDQDLLWRVEMMNALRPLYADDFADVVTTLERVHPADPTVLLLGRNLPDTTHDSLLDLRAARPHTSVIAIASDQVPSGGLAGVDEVVDSAISDEDLVPVVAEFVASHRRSQPELALRGGPAIDAESAVADARLILVTSAKGGVGRSTVAVNLAVALARNGHEARVALVDTDPVYGDIAMMLGLIGPGRRGELTGDLLTEELVLGRCTFPFGDDGLDVVLPPQPGDPWERMDSDDVTVLTGAVALNHNWIVLDVSPTLLHDTRLPLLADLIYVVAPTDLPGLKNATILASALRLRVTNPGGIELVLVDRDEQGRTAAAVAEAAGVTVAASIPFDRRVSTALERQQPLVLLHPHSPASRNLRSLGDRTLRSLGAAAHHATGRQRA